MPRNVLEALTIKEHEVELRESAVVSMAAYILQTQGFDTDPRSTHDDTSFDTALTRQRRHNAKFSQVDETISTAHLIIAATKMAQKVIERTEARDAAFVLPARFLELDEQVMHIVAPLYEDQAEQVAAS